MSFRRLYLLAEPELRQVRRAFSSMMPLDGCQDERKYKDFLRRHTLPSQVWYKAYPGLTAIDLERNSRIREGLEATRLNEEEAREWVALL